MRKNLFLLACFFFIQPTLFASDLFMKFSNEGYFSVTISDQTSMNSNSVFRFFDLPAGNYDLTISDIYTGTKVFKGQISLRADLRKVISFDKNWNMIEVAEFSVNRANWYSENTIQQPNSSTNELATSNSAQVTTTVNTNTTATNSNVLPLTNGENEIVEVVILPMNKSEFETYKQKIVGESFDRTRSEVAKELLTNRYLTSEQIADICKLFSFDNYRLEYAKFAYRNCTDKSNYIKVQETFSFASYKSELEAYMNEK